MKTSVRRFLCLSIAFLSSPLWAGINRWTSRGPESGGRISGIVVGSADGQLVYASSQSGGVHKSEDGGQHWKQVNRGLTDWRVTALSIPPDEPATIYAVTAAGEVFKSENGGEEWRPVYAETTRRALDVVALEDDVVLAGPLNVSNTLLRSTDGGRTWTAVTARCEGSILERSAQNTIACGGYPLSLSTDGGVTFRSLDSGPYFSALAFGHDGAMYAVWSSVVFRSADSGKSWQQFADLRQPARIFYDIHVSSDGAVLVATDRGIQEFRKGTWHSNESESQFLSFADGDPSSGRLYAASANDGVFTKGRADASWIEVSTGMRNASVSDVAVSPFEPAQVYAANGNARFRSDDHDGSWEHVGADGAGWITVNPGAPNIVYASDRDALVRSTDRGDTWTIIQPAPATSLEVAPRDPAVVYAALMYRGMVMSEDFGQTWRSIGHDMPYSYYAFAFAAEIAVGPDDTATVYAAHSDGLFKTTSRGAHWHILSRIGARVAIDPHDPATLFAIFFNHSASSLPQGLAKSIDGGSTWAAVSTAPSVVTDVVFDPAASGVLYLAAGQSVYRSDDHGATWSPFGSGLDGPWLHRLGIDASGHFLSAATSAGVFEYEISAVDVSAALDSPPDMESLLDALALEPRAGWVLPVAGRVGNRYRTSVTIENDGDSPQDVILAWLPAGGGANSLFRLTVPAGTHTIPEVMRRLRLNGIGSIVTIAVDASGDLDRNASIGGSARICSHAVDRNPFCETVHAIRRDAFSPHARATVTGLRTGADVRTNVGITNLSSRTQRYTVGTSIEVTVPPFSLHQSALAAGSASIEVTAEDPSAAWFSYGSSIDVNTGLTSTKVGNP